MRKSGRVLQFPNARQPKQSQSLQGLLKTQVLKITHNLQERAKEAVFSTASPDDSCEQDTLDITGMERTVARVRRKKEKKKKLLRTVSKTQVKLSLTQHLRQGFLVLLT